MLQTTKLNWQMIMLQVVTIVIYPTSVHSVKKSMFQSVLESLEIVLCIEN